MAVYKVPQDVEADDKLLGPFSFRQFIYLIVAAVGIGLAWGLSRLFLPLFVIPLPVILFFGILALPLRKDQPMEIYLAAVLSFYLKPHRRLWKPDGIQSLVEITVPKTIEVQRMKNLSQTEAQQRLSYLANIVDTGGWAVRGVAMPDANSAMQTDAYFEAQQTQDVLDTSGGVAHSIDEMLTQADTKRHQDMLTRMQQQVAGVPAAQIIDPYANLGSPTLAEPEPELAATPDPHLTYNPYPDEMRQHVVQPMSEQPIAPPQAVAQAIAPPVKTTSEKPVSPDIINLANNPDLSIETIAHEANRIHQKEESSEEVVISLR